MSLDITKDRIEDIGRDQPPAFDTGTYAGERGVRWWVRRPIPRHSPSSCTLVEASQEEVHRWSSFGYALSSKEHAPNDLVNNARRAEEVGFSFALISDHYHPWIDRQGHSPFVRSVIGGIAQATGRLRLGTGVTCPAIRYHPANIAQAAATSATMKPGRFFLGVGSGENLNEHILGDRWPSVEFGRR